MTQQQKEQISKLRASGASFGKIASALGMSVNTVKSYCKRNPVSAAPVLDQTAAVHTPLPTVQRCTQAVARASAEAVLLPNVPDGMVVGTSGADGTQESVPG